MNSRSYVLCCTVAALAMPALAFGALGGDFSSVQDDQAKLKATLRVARTAANYTVHEIQASSGSVVREYVSANGTVFGVAWKGSVMPDLRQILGQYFETYTKSPKSIPSGHSQRLIQQPGLVVHSSGHMRAFAGFAYIPQMLPLGVTGQEIQ